MGLFGNDDREAQERIQEGRRQLRRAVRQAQSQGTDICHCCTDKPATTTKNGDPHCSDC